MLRTELSHALTRDELIAFHRKVPARHLIVAARQLSTEEYIQRIRNGQPTAIEVHRMTPAEQLGDALFTGLRLTDGLDLDAVGQRYGVDVWSRYADDLAPFVDAGCLLHDGPRLRLTRQGMLVANEVMAVFV